MLGMESTMMTIDTPIILPAPVAVAKDKMRINVVTVRSGWILQKIAGRIVDNSPRDVQMKLIHAPRRNENNFYVDVTNCFMGPAGGKDVGLFTHVHENSNDSIKDHWFSLDHIIHMSRRSRNIFEDDKRNYNSKVIHSCKMQYINISHLYDLYLLVFQYQ